MTERDRFLTRLDTARKNGLVDVKFLFHPSRAVKPEEIFAGLNEIEDAIEGGRCVRHAKWDGDDPVAAEPAYA